MKHLRTRSRRIWPPIIGGAALFVAILVATLGVGSASSNGTTQQLAASTPTRHNDSTANRGSGRSTDSTTSSSSTTSSTEASTTTTVAPTTTTVAPTTTTVHHVTTTTTTVPVTTTTVAASHSQTGGASYYSQPWSAKGCAHKTLPKGTVVTVTNLANGKSTTCVINDRGPYVSGRIIDMDTTIFEKVASTSQGVFQARITW